MVQGCTETGQQFGSNAGKVWSQRIANFKMFGQLFSNFFGTLSAGMFLGAEIYYNDIINIFGAAGSLAYVMWIKGL